jgi:hypothetical protein
MVVRWMLDNEWYLGVGFRGRISHQYPSGSCWFNQIGNVYRFDLYERAEVGCVADAEMEEWSDSLNGVTVLVEFITTWGSSIIFALQSAVQRQRGKPKKRARILPAAAWASLRPKLPRTSPSPSL